MSQALIDLDLFDPGGCETPPLPFNPEQIEVIKKVVSGEAFENPISGAVNGALNGLNNAFGKLHGINLRLTDPIKLMHFQLVLPTHFKMPAVS